MSQNSFLLGKSGRSIMIKVNKYKVIAGVATLIGCLSANAATQFNANIFFPATHPLGKHGYVEWAESLKASSNGELQPKVFTGTVLLPARAGMSGLRDDIAQVGYHYSGYTPAELPVSTAIQELGFNYDDPLVAAVANTDFNMNDKELLGEWKKAGIIFGGGYSTPAYNLMCSMPVRNLAEIKGKRLRTNGNALSRWAEKVGAVPVNVPSSEMYQGLEKGTLDCALNVASDLKSRSLWDVAKHTTMVPLGLAWAGPMWGYNPKFWRGLPENHKRLMFDENAKAMAKLYVGYNASVTEALNEAKGHGVSVYEPSADMLATIKQFASDNMTNVYTMASEKYKVADPRKLFGRFDATIQKWDSLFANVDRNNASAIEAIIKSELFDKIDVASYGL
jgi:TRAP-type C4-dicarboxylate transport system substrate-binding protein